MAIVATEVESVHGAVGQQRMIFYRCQDSEGTWHSYGPVITIDVNFDPESYKTVVAGKVMDSLAGQEVRDLLDE